MNNVIYDITMEMRPGMLGYPGDQQFAVEEGMEISKGDICNISSITMSSHTGTHVDAPKHFIDDGKCVHELGFEHFTGNAKVFSIMDSNAITAEDLQNLDIQKGDIALLKTKNSALLREKDFTHDFVHITASAAKHLLDAGIITLGFDYITIEKATDNNDFEVHRLLLGNDIVIIEGLDLYDVPPGEYEITAMLLKIRGGNGSPVRAVLSANR